MDIRFDGKIAVVTGAGRGLGRAHALDLARRGAKVVVNDFGSAVHGSSPSSEAANSVVDEIKAAGGNALADAGSVTSAKDVKALVKKTMDAYGRIDILINNAGVLRDKSFHKMSFEDFEFVIDVHLTGAARVTHAIWPIMREQQYGRVVLTSSGSGIFGNFGQANYAAAKMAMLGLMNALRMEGEKNNIRINTICPTAATRMSDGIFPAEFIDRLKPEYVTAGVTYLCSEDAPTGVVLCAGGGAFTLAGVMESIGVHLDPKDITAEQIRDKWDQISDFSETRQHATVFDQALRIFEVDSVPNS